MIWYIAVGSAAGGVLRYVLTAFIQTRAGTVFPTGTLLINVTGSLLLGFLLSYALATPAIPVGVRALLTTGFCGGYTTFSTFSYETIRLVEDGQYSRAGLYIGLSIVASLGAAALGFAAAHQLLAFRRAL